MQKVCQTVLPRYSDLCLIIKVCHRFHIKVLLKTMKQETDQYSKNCPLTILSLINASASFNTIYIVFSLKYQILKSIINSQKRSTLKIKLILRCYCLQTKRKTQLFSLKHGLISYHFLECHCLILGISTITITIRYTTTKKTILTDEYSILKENVCYY